MRSGPTARAMPTYKLCGGPRCGNALTGVTMNASLTPMVKTQIYFTEGDLAALHQAARRTRKSVTELVREAVRRVWVPAPGRGPVALWDGEPRSTSVDHDSIYDES